MQQQNVDLSDALERGVVANKSSHSGRDRRRYVNGIWRAETVLRAEARGLVCNWECHRQPRQVGVCGRERVDRVDSIDVVFSRGVYEQLGHRDGRGHRRPAPLDPLEQLRRSETAPWMRIEMMDERSLVRRIQSPAHAGEGSRRVLGLPIQDHRVSSDDDL